MPMRLFKKNPVTYILSLKKTNQMHFVLSMIDSRIFNVYVLQTITAPSSDVDSFSASHSAFL